MQIWVDADACPVTIREIIFRAATRKNIVATFIANCAVQVPPSPFLKCLIVSAGFDVADNEIVHRAETGDLAVTSDIPLAAELIEKGVTTISFRGERYSSETIKARLGMRDFMETMRASGVHGGGPKPMGLPERKAFADTLDRALTKLNR